METSIFLIVSYKKLITEKFDINKVQKWYNVTQTNY